MEYRYSKGGEVFFFRQNRSIYDLIELAKLPFIKASDESKDIEIHKQISLFDELDLSNGCEESCEPFAVNY